MRKSTGSFNQGSTNLRQHTENEHSYSTELDFNGFETYDSAPARSTCDTFRDEEYGDEVYRSVTAIAPSVDFGNPLAPMGAQRWEPMDLPFGLQFNDNSAFQKGHKFELVMAQPNNAMPTGRIAHSDFLKDEMSSDDEELYESEMMVEEDDCVDMGTLPLPEHYKRDSTFVSTTSADETANGVEALMTRILHDKVQYTRDAHSTFEGTFFMGSSACEFAVNVYEGSVGAGAQETWIEFVNYSTGSGGHQAFSEFFRIVTDELRTTGIISGLVDETYFPLAGLETSETESDDEEEDSNVSEDAVKCVIQERVDALNRCNFAGAQKELLSELSDLVESYPSAVAAAKNAAPTLAKLLKKNATSDYQICRVALKLVRTLLSDEFFTSQLNEKLPKALIRTATKVKSMVWKNDLALTVAALESSGIFCKGRPVRKQNREIRRRLVF